MKNVLVFLAKLTLCSALLFAALRPLQIAYETVLFNVIGLFPQSAQIPLSGTFVSALWLIPTLALLLATPRISWKRRLLLLALAPAVYWLLDVASFLAWTHPPAPGIASGRAHYLYSLVWKMTGQWVLPFLFWLTAAHREVSAYLARR